MKSKDERVTMPTDLHGNSSVKVNRLVLTCLIIKCCHFIYCPYCHVLSI